MIHTLRSLILHNFWLKFFSLALATVIWMSIDYSIRHEESISQININRVLPQAYFRVPIEIITAPGESRSFKIIPNEVMVVGVGDANTLRQAAQKSIKAYVDLTDVPSGEVTVKDVQTENPPNLTITEVKPAQVQVVEVSK